MTENEISKQIIGTAINLHKNLGPWLFESAYENALAFDLREIGLDVKQQLFIKKLNWMLDTDWIY